MAHSADQLRRVVPDGPRGPRLLAPRSRSAGCSPCRSCRSWRPCCASGGEQFGVGRVRQIVDDAPAVRRSTLGDARDLGRLVVDVLLDRSRRRTRCASPGRRGRSPTPAAPIERRRRASTLRRRRHRPRPRRPPQGQRRRRRGRRARRDRGAGRPRTVDEDVAASRERRRPSCARARRGGRSAWLGVAAPPKVARGAAGAAARARPHGRSRRAGRARRAARPRPRAADDEEDAR